MPHNPFQIYEKSPKFNVSLKHQNDFLSEETLAPTSKAKGFFGIILTEARLDGWLFFILLGILLIFLKLGYLQIIKGDYFLQKALGNRLRILEIKANRGLIYDRFHQPLVKNNYNFILELVPVDLPKEPGKLEALINQIAQILNKNPQEIKDLIFQIETHSYQPIVIQDNLNYNQAVLTKIASVNFPGLNLAIGRNRQYLESQAVLSLSHLLGYLSKISDKDFENYPDADYSLTDFLGRTGLELNYEAILRGQKGQAEVEVDALGVRKEILAYQEPKVGEDLILTLDLEIQKKLEQIFTRVLKGFNKKRGAAIVLDPQNGEILAMVSLPSFNNNDFVSGISPEKFQELTTDENQPLFNRAIAGTYPSGSIIKPILAAAALQEGIITTNTTFLSTGGLWVADRWFFPDWKAGGHGKTNIYKALAESVNTFFYIIGGGYKDFSGLGIEMMIEYYQLAGVGKKLGLDLPSEAGGLLPTEKWKKETKGENWYIGDTYHLAIGQGDLLVTPLQVASWTALLANGGTLYQPHLVKAITDPTTGKSFIVPKRILAANFFEPKNLAIVRQGLRQVVTAGSAPQLYDLPIRVAGKTGTAQWSNKKSPHAWFTGFAPEDQPEIVITILIEEGGEGSQVAVPVAKEFWQWWAQHH